jgi:RNA polymerase sigma factor (sigma-70 family)
MAHPPVQRFLSRIRGLVRQTGGGPTTDAALLHRFVEQHDDAAFADLLDRHGGLVWGVCYRVLGHVADAEDAFQASFLVLARKAGVVRKESLPGWLHGVAMRVASRLRRGETARRQRESQAGLRESGNEPDEPTWREVRQVLDEELARLPDKYRLPLLLCYLEGKTQDEAAQELGWAVGVFRGRLDRGREQLRQRLLRRGIGLPAALAAALMAGRGVRAAVAADLAAKTVRAVSLCAAGEAAASAPLSAVVEGVLRAMWLTNIKVAAALVLSFALLAGVQVCCRSR